jgi:hypothetical protein
MEIIFEDYAWRYNVNSKTSSDYSIQGIKSISIGKIFRNSHAINDIDKHTIKVIRESGLFYYIYYVDTYPEVNILNIDPLVHYTLYGWKIDYNPNPLFDTEWYLNKYIEVKQTGLNPLFHYIETGASLGYDTSPEFSTSAYINANLDVKKTGANPLFHYLSKGVIEGRPLS